MKLSSSSVSALPGPAACVGESPVWQPAVKRLSWIDIRGCALFSWSIAQGTLYTKLSDLPGALMLGADNELIIAMGSCLYVVGDNHQLTPIVEGLLEDCERFNDGVIDRSGLAILGVVQRDRRSAKNGALVVVQDGQAQRLDFKIGLPNGFAFDAQERVMLFSDTDVASRTIWCSDHTAGVGPSIPRRFAKLDNGRPDGGVIDAFGIYWCCAIGAGQIIGLDSRARVVAVINLPVQNPTNLVITENSVFVTTMSTGSRDKFCGRVLQFAKSVLNESLTKYSSSTNKPEEFLDKPKMRRIINEK